MCRHNFNQLSPDQTLENTKKVCKTVGGLYQLQRIALLVMYDVLPTT